MTNSRPSVARFLWNHNPFYVISALLMLYSVRKSYGELDIGTINVWAMMGVLAAYTVVLAMIGSLIVRWGKVWDDARSILLVLLLLFLAISNCADDLFVKMESARGGAILMISGFGFSVAVLLGVLRATQIHLKLVYLLPLTLFLALFFVAPWWCSPELHPQNSVTLDWTVFCFPQIAAILTLLLIPAARMGQKSVEGNGTPWPWPLFPWSAFVFIGIAIVLRSYSLTMTFSQTGPIWAAPNQRSGIIFDTIWRPYFLVPLAFSLLMLMIEAGIATGSRFLLKRAFNLAPYTLLLSWPIFPSDTMRIFLTHLTRTVGSPVWLTVWLLIAFFSWTAIRRVEWSISRVFACVMLLAVVGPRSVSLETLTAPNPVPMFLSGIVLGLMGIARMSSTHSLSAACFMTAGLWFWLPTVPFAEYRLPICFHVMLLACIAISLIWRDPLAIWLQGICSLLLLFAVMAIVSETAIRQISWEVRTVYSLGIVLASYTSARFTRNPWYWMVVVVSIGGLGYGVAAETYRTAVAAFGRNSVIAFCWSFGTLLTGVLISSYKANWLPAINWGTIGLGPAQSPVVEFESTSIRPQETPPDFTGEA